MSPRREPSLGCSGVRERLVRRIEMEARAYVNAKGSSRDAMILGRVYGLLEAGTLEGYWRKRDADSAGELVANRLPRLLRLPWRPT